MEDYYQDVYQVDDGGYDIVEHSDPSHHEDPRTHPSRRMATYNFPPPPPPPGGPPQSGYQQQPQYGYGQPPQHQQPPRGGGPPRGGRGGNQGGRGDFHGASPYGQTNGYNGPPQQHGPPQGQGPPIGYNPQQPYLIGPQAPPQAGPPHQGPGLQGGYPGPQNQGQGPPQWQQDQHHPQQHGPPQHGPPHNGPPHQQPPHQQGPPPAAPLSAQNYHPNYAPQAYNPQYGPQQPPQHFQGPPQHQPPYAQHGPPPGPPQWQGPPQHGPPQFNNRGRGRGGFNAPRGGHPAPLPMGPPIRMGFDGERDQMAQAGNSFPQPYQNHQSLPAPPFSQPPYQGFPPPNDFSQRPPLDQNPFNASQRGRGNFQRGGNRGGGRGDFQFRGRDNNRHHNNGGQRAPSNEQYQKPAGAEAGGKKKKKRRTNTLGLTPNGVDHEDSDDEIDDVDEEARLVTLLGPDTPLVPTDLDAWLLERKNKFPTKARREAAAEELRKRREQGQNGNKVKQEKPVKKEEGETKLERQQRKAEKLRAELEKAERKIQDSMSGSKRKRDTGDEGDDDRGQVSEDESSSSSDSDSGSSKPETMSSRNAVRNLPQPPKAQLQRHCKYFSTGGTCGKKGKCRFVHDQEVRDQALKDKEANGGKMTLAQRLILNDTAKDDLTILKSIKYLKEKGLMPEASSTGSANGDGTSFKTEENGYTNMEYGDTN